MKERIFMASKHVVAEFGQYKVFEIIFEKEVAKNSQNPNFETLLHLQCRNELIL